MNDKYIVIMAGGRGERFWPKSRLSRPKHLLPIVGNDSMLTQTLNRIKNIVPLSNIFIITNKEQHAAIIDTCPTLHPSQIIAEPIGRDTAPAVILAKVLVKKQNPNATFAILPADHVINDVYQLEKCLNTAFDVALKNDVLVTIGIVPTSPSSAYGYIQKGNSFEPDNRFFKVNKFVEKPNTELAKQYLDSQQYFWNAGMFIWTIPSLESALTKYCPELSNHFFELEKTLTTTPFNDCIFQCYEKLPKISIDYALLEKAQNVITLPSSFDWDDVGEWSAIARHFPHDSEKNVVHGDAILYHSNNNIVVNENNHLTTLIGVENLIVVQTKDATLICHKEKAQDIKFLLKKLQENPKYSHLL